MSFTYPILLGGLLAVALPVMLHLLLRQKPKTLQFPAFRFLVKRHRTNLTKLRLRHFLLLALRIFLFALLCLALAQPKILDDPWSISSDRAVTAVFVFDTSASMDYTIAGNLSRLKEAQKRAVELLKLLPPNSEIVVLDTADAAPPGKNDWLTLEKTAERIGQLRIQPANQAVTTRLAVALRLFARVAAGKAEREGDGEAAGSGEGERAQRPRLLCVFSDRTRAAWNKEECKNLQALANQVPPAFARLAAARSGIRELLAMLPNLRQLLPQATQESGERALSERLQSLFERIGELSAESYLDTETRPLLTAVRSQQQDLLAALEKLSENLSDEAKTYRDQLQVAVRDVLRGTAGFNSFYVDVGVEPPTDLALLDFQLVREADGPGGGLRVKLRVEVQATGADFQPTVVCEVDGTVRDEKGVEVKAGQRESVVFDLKADDLKTRVHQAKVFVKTSDALASNNSRYLTYAVRPILLLRDEVNADEAARWKRAIEANRIGAALYRCDVKLPDAFDDRAAGALDDYAAVYLCGLRQPGEKLWALLKDYVLKGRGLGVLPPLAEGSKAAYNDSALAQEILPASLEGIVTFAGGAEWNWDPQDIYKHSLLHPFLEWKRGRFDIFVQPRKALLYWQTQPRPGAQVLVRYAADKNLPAWIERIVDRNKGKSGRVLLFTTPPGWQQWNNYRDDGNSFYLVLARLCVGYLTGDLDRPALNFVSSQPGPLVPVPVNNQATSYRLQRDAVPIGMNVVAQVTAEAGFNEVRVAQVAEPGNYTIGVEPPAEAVAWFSVNVLGDESDLSRTSKEEIDAVLGPDAVLTVVAQTDLNDVMQGKLTRPWELFPVLMVVLLLVLAVENLLANKFYRREPVNRDAQQ